MTSRGRVALAVLCAAVLALTGCQSSTGGIAVAVDVGSVSGLPLTDFPSGPRADAPDPGFKAENATGSNEDNLALDAIGDLNEYWKQTLPQQFGVQFQPLKRYISYDSARPTTSSECGELNEPNAFYCPAGDLIAWDRGQLLPLMTRAYGSIAPVTVLAHEFGHAIQTRLADAGKMQLDRSTPTIVFEQQADCFAGVFLRWVADNKSRRLQISTVGGLNSALGSLYFVRDQPGQTDMAQSAHGSAFDRTLAFQEGFEDGPKKCAGYTYDSIHQRSTQMDFNANDKNKGDLQINNDTVGIIKKSLDSAYQGKNGPAVVENGGACSDGADTSPASYCEDGNQVTVDDAKLAQIGAPIDRQSEFSGKPRSGEGDFSAFATIASRYVLGVQKNDRLPIDTAMSGMRTACMVGGWANATNKIQGRGTLHLSPGDVDEAILGMLQRDSLIAADVNGKSVPAGFLRVEAFRTGYTQGAGSCTSKYAESAGGN